MKPICIAPLAASLIILALSWSACGDDGGGGTYACAYEQRRTEGCSAASWQDWVYECVEFNADDYFITPEEVCANLTEDGLFCQAGCCIDYEHRSIDLNRGSCY